MIEKRGKLWWPLEDHHCFASVQHEILYINKMLSFCPNKRTVVQAGGNAGVFPLVFADHFQDVYSFEPEEINFECLSRNTAEKKNIQIFKLGLGEKHKTSGMHRLAENCGAHYLEGHGDIVVVPLDDFEIQNCDLLQLDIEGYEFFALQGAEQTIKRCKPVIICEEKGLGRIHGIEKDRITCFLLDLGYKISDTILNDVVYTR